MYNPRFEWAYSSEESTVICCRARLPTLSEAQQLTENLALTSDQLAEFYEYVAAEWRRGAVCSYFKRELNAGRLITTVKQTHLEAGTVTVYMHKSSRLHRAFTELGEDPVDTKRVFEHIYNSLQACTRSAPTLRPARPETTYPPVAAGK